MPLRDWFGIATGVLNWQPDQFWSCTPIEYFAAVDALNDYNRGQSGVPAPATSDDLAYLMAKYPDKQ